MARHEHILILDFGSQFTQLIARRVREFQVYCEIRPCTTTLDAVREFGPKGIILSGGPSSVGTDASPTVDAGIFDLGVPILGVCYGQQLMCDLLGGKVEGCDQREFGRAQLKIEKTSTLWPEAFSLGEESQVWMSHGDRVTALPTGFDAVGTTPSSPFAAIANEHRNLFGVQFHPEVMHTLKGKQLLQHFVCSICECAGDWTMASFRDETIEAVRRQVGSAQVLCAVSGGVDSSVVAALLHQALGNQLHCFFVDTGMLRMDEAEEVRQRLAVRLGIPIHFVDASELFLSRLDGVSDPERKRKIIGESFIDVFEKEASAIENVDFLAQGTLYPDVIESVSFHGGPSVTIKSHHNVGGLPERMNLKLVEPVRELFKDEVRALGRQLGMTPDMIDRHPFPGPGLAIRIPGEISTEKLDILRKADRIYIEEIRTAGLYDEIWQAFCVLLPVRTVGVMGDARTYEYVCALRAVTSTDGMTADYYHFDHNFLSKVANRIINEVRGINRVVYDITSKPPGTIEWE